MIDDILDDYESSKLSVGELLIYNMAFHLSTHPNVDLQLEDLSELVGQFEKFLDDLET
jgi:hypothetical protein